MEQDFYEIMSNSKVDLQEHSGTSGSIPWSVGNMG